MTGILKEKEYPERRWKFFLRLLAASLITAGLALCVIFRTPGYDLSKVDPALRNLKQPCQKVLSVYWLDGGSISLEILDGDGKTLLLVLPGPDRRPETKPYSRLIPGVFDPMQHGGREVNCTADDKRLIAFLIDHYADPITPATPCLNVLRDSPRDRLKVWWNAHRSNF